MRQAHNLKVVGSNPTPATKMQKKDQKKFTIIIPSKIFDDNLENCIKSIRKYYKLIKIIIVLDKKKKIAKNKNIKVIITGSKTIGYKRNLAAKLTNSELITFIDSDAFPKHKWLDSALKSFKKFKDIKIIGGPNLSPSSKEIEKQLAARVRNLPFVTFDTFIKKRGINEKAVNFLPACNFTINRETYLKIGGMIDNIYSGEEMALMKNLRDKNYKLLLNFKSYVYHKERNFKHFFRQRFIYGSTALYYIFKYPCRETFFLFFSTFPFLYLLAFPVALYNSFFLKIYFSILLILFAFCLLCAVKINFKNNFFKSFKLIILSVFGPGIGLVSSLFLDKKKMKKLYTQK